MSKWVGFAVSVSCGEPLGCYQGTIVAADGGTITLTKVFRNGFPYPMPQVTLNAADIKELKIIEERNEKAQTHSTVVVTKPKKGHKATVCESLQANPSSSGSPGGPSNKAGQGGQGGGARAAPARSKPIDIQGPHNPRSNKNTHSGSYGAGGGSTPRNQHQQQHQQHQQHQQPQRGGGSAVDRHRRRNEGTFGGQIEDEITTDFDFEKNLALFDKQAMWDQIRRSQKPGLVRQAEGSGKFRHDENILGGNTGEGGDSGVVVPDRLRGGVAYVTDAGARLWSVDGGCRQRLWRALQARGLLEAARLLLARAAVDVALKLVGGERRLDARNAHQAPRALCVCGGGEAGAAAAAAARLLASHGVRLRCALDSPRGQASKELALELGRLEEACGAGVLVRSEAELAAAAAKADLVLLGAEAAPAPVLATRAVLVRLEPGPKAAHDGAKARASVWALLPAESAPSSEALGRLYLANVAPPAALFEAEGIAYRSPFGGATALALHAADD